MSTTLRPFAVSLCSSCLRRRAFPTKIELNGPSAPGYQQVRGKKKMPNNSGTVMVRLRKDVATYGVKGSIVPVVPGQMRNNWFPRGVAEYITRPDLKRLRESHTPMERDFEFFTKARKSAEVESDLLEPTVVTDSPALRDASMFRENEFDISSLTPERVSGLVDIFVPLRLEFYRQPVPEEPTPMSSPAAEERIAGASDAANDLAFAHASAIPRTKEHVSTYHGVTTQDVATAVRAALAENDEARRVLVSVDDIRFVDLPQVDGVSAEEVRCIGNFIVEMKVPGAAGPARRTVSVIAQDS